MITTFNGTASNNAAFGIESVMRVGRPISPGHRPRLLPTTGRAGTFFLGKDRDPLYLPIRFVFKGTTMQDKRTKSRAIAAWLDTPDVATLSFSDDPDIQYSAICVDRIDIEEVTVLGFADVTFFVPSSYAEAPATKTASPNAGTVETPVQITVTMTANSPTLKVSLSVSEYVLITTALVIGDVVVIDTNLHTVTLNGDDARQYVSFNSTYFALPVGAFTLTPLPASTVAIVFRERWK